MSVSYTHDAGPAGRGRGPSSPIPSPQPHPPPTWVLCRSSVSKEGESVESRWASKLKDLRSSHDSIVSLWTNHFILRSHEFFTQENVRCLRSSTSTCGGGGVVFKHLYEGKKKTPIKLASVYVICNVLENNGQIIS